jgi:predicted RNase H-related nuclease YkuK (DUF458 family)
MEQRQFKKLANRENVDLIPYIQEYMEQFPETEIWIGNDSQNRKHNSVYALCIGLNRPGKGAHVLYSKYEVPRIKDNRERLIKETWDSIVLAEFIKDNSGIKATLIDIDINPDVKFGSNSALSSCAGMCTGYGYEYRDKGKHPQLTYASDSLVKH